jgi:hypothetical protein
MALSSSAFKGFGRANFMGYKRTISMSAKDTASDGIKSNKVMVFRQRFLACLDRERFLMYSLTASP